MTTIVKIKRSETASAIPLSTDLEVGELAVNLADKKIFSKNSAGTVIEFGGGTSNSFPSDWGSITDAIISLMYDFGSVADAV